MSTLYVDNLVEKSSGHGVLIPGSICQVVEQKLSGRTVVNVSGSWGTSWASGLKCSITPKSANPTLYIICQLQYTSTGFNAGYVLFDNTNSNYVLFNDQSTAAYGATSGRKHLSSGGLGSQGFAYQGSNADDYGNSSRTATGKYTPPNNNTLEIEVYMAALNSTGSIYIGGNESNDNMAYDSYSHCSITIMEVAG